LPARDGSSSAIRANPLARPDEAAPPPTRYGGSVLHRVLRCVNPLDAITAGALCLASQVEVWAPDAMVGTDSVDGSRPLLSATAAVGSAALALRCSAPAAAGAAVFGAWGLQGLLTTPTQGLVGLICLALAAYSVAAHADPRYAPLVAGVALAATAALGEDAADWTFISVVLAAAAAAGAALRRRRGQVDRLRDRAATLIRERDEAVELERSRLARELHDVVSHHVMTMVVQAEAGRARIEDRDAVVASLAAIEGGGRAALADLRALLGVLRDADVPAERQPSPGLDDLPALLARMRAAGLPVALHVQGDGRPPAGVSLAAYRIVQEALTNVLKHAGAATADVTIEHADAGLRVTVSDTGVGSDGSATSGIGLASMHERVAAYGGVLEVGGAPGEGFIVDAWFPAGAP
jgi:signal transduction histidine kinase